MINSTLSSYLVIFFFFSNDNCLVHFGVNNNSITRDLLFSLSIFLIYTKTIILRAHIHIYRASKSFNSLYIIQISFFLFYFFFLNMKYVSVYRACNFFFLASLHVIPF